MESGGASGGGDFGEAWSQLALIVATVDGALGKWLAETHGIGLPEYRAALHLSRAPGRELRITELAQRIGLNQSSVTRLVGRMEAKGLAYRDVCPDDGRGVFAVITERGLGLAREVREPYEARLRELLAERHPQLDLAGIERSLAVIGVAAR